MTERIKLIIGLVVLFAIPVVGLVVCNALMLALSVMVGG